MHDLGEVRAVWWVIGMVRWRLQLGVKMKCEIMSVTIFFTDLEWERIVSGYEYGIGAC